MLNCSGTSTSLLQNLYSPNVRVWEFFNCSGTPTYITAARLHKGNAKGETCGEFFVLSLSQKI